MASGGKLPRFTIADVETPQELVNRLNRLLVTLELRFQQVEGPLVDPREPATGEEAYVVTNAVEKRTLDASAASATDIADVLGTFLEDLKNQGRLR